MSPAIHSIVLDSSFPRVSIDAIQKAKKEILITTFRMDWSEKREARPLMAFFDILIEKAKAGVRVKIITNIHLGNKMASNHNKITAKNLSSAGIQTRGPRTTRIIHAKLIIIDREIVIIGSHNLTARAFCKNKEASLFLCYDEISSMYARYFDTIWAECSEPQWR